MLVGEDIAPCPSCTLKIRVIYDEDDLPPLKASLNIDREDGGVSFHSSAPSL